MKKYIVQNGFTLIEVMIVVVLVSILSAIAYPSYTEYMAKAKRAQARSNMLMAQQWMERFYSENYSYYRIRGSSKTVSDLYPVNLKQSPPPGEGAVQYTIEVKVDQATPESFVLSLIRKSGSSMSADRCGNLDVDQYGRKTPKNYDSSKFSSDKAALEYCWK